LRHQQGSGLSRQQRPRKVIAKRNNLVDIAAGEVSQHGLKGGRFP